MCILLAEVCKNMHFARQTLKVKSIPKIFTHKFELMRQLVKIKAYLTFYMILVFDNNIELSNIFPNLNKPPFK